MSSKILLGFLLVGLFSFRSLQEQQPETAEQIREKGDKITQESATVLSKVVMKAMASGGVENAAKFCNVKAYPLTDSLSNANNVSIKRTAIRFRNSKNAPKKTEKELFLSYENDKKAGNELKSKVIQQKNGNWLYVRPILLQPQCQVCHGKVGETLTAENHAIIKKLYPKDKAVGFSAGDLRGMWVLKFTKK